jgi:hypothetical protein
VSPSFPFKAPFDNLQDMFATSEWPEAVDDEFLAVKNKQNFCCDIAINKSLKN